MSKMHWHRLHSGMLLLGLGGIHAVRLQLGTIEPFVSKSWSLARNESGRKDQMWRRWYLQSPSSLQPAATGTSPEDEGASSCTRCSS